MDLYHEVHDGGCGPHMLMVHGFLSSRAQWRPNLARLMTVCRPVLVELLGHGRSAAPVAPEAYAVERYIERFEELRRSLGIERWMICGQSFGAGLVIQYALQHPDRVMGLVVTNSISAFTPKGDPERDAAQAERARAIAEGGMHALRELRIHPRHAKRFPEDIKHELVADAERLAPEGILRSIAMTSPSLSVAHRLGDLKVPTLLVNGTWEKRFQPLREHAAITIPGVTVVDLPAGHSVNIEASEGFDEAVCALIAKVSG
ncbi:MAG: alpha/beta fold hydrolase [Hyphomicrobiaceae bacterium]